jgi:hypothetical protein
MRGLLLVGWVAGLMERVCVVLFEGCEVMRD